MAKRSTSKSTQTFSQSNIMWCHSETGGPWELISTRNKYGSKTHVIYGNSHMACVEFMYLVFTDMPGASYRRQLGSLLYLRCIFWVLINFPCLGSFCRIMSMPNILFPLTHVCIFFNKLHPAFPYLETSLEGDPSEACVFRITLFSNVLHVLHVQQMQ